MQTSRSRPRRRTLGTLAASAVILSALAILTTPAGAGAGAKVLAWGNTSAGNALKVPLENRGHSVAVSAGLPSDLSTYDIVWTLGSAALSSGQQQQLADFVRSGKGVYLNGAIGASAMEVVHSLTGSSSVSAVSGTGSLIQFEPSAKGDVTTDPNALGQMDGTFSVGRLSGVSGPNVLGTNGFGVPVGGVWAPDDMVNGQGRVVTLVNTFWLQFATPSMKVAAMVNLTEFLHNDNAPPVVSIAGADGVEAVEGSSVALHGSAVDPDDDPLVLWWTWAAGGGVHPGAVCAFSDGGAAETTVSCSDDGEYVVTLTADDGVNPAVSASAVVNVSNAAPLVTLDAPAEGSALPVGWPVEAMVSSADPGTNDTHTCTVDWGDGSAGGCTDAHSYAAAGFYTVTATVVDDDGGAGHDSASVVVYDPDGGFVTGGGVAGGPPGVPFSVSVRYAHGDSVPSGHLRVGSFRATSFAWLIADAANGTAVVAGVGTLDGEPVTFRLSAAAGRGRSGGTLDLSLDGVASGTVADGGPQPVRGNLDVHAQ